MTQISAATSSVVTRAGLIPAVTLFMLAMLIPVQLYLGPLRLSPYRIVLLIAFVPAALHLLGAARTRLLAADVCFVAFTALVCFSFAWHGDGLPAIGIFIVETLGPYFLARAYIRSADHFRSFVRLFVTIVVAMLPLAVIEAVSNQSVVLRAFDLVFPDVIRPAGEEQRLGLRRAQVVFEHPILFGIYSSMAISLSFYVAGHGRSLAGRAPLTALVLLTAFLCLSAGPLVGIGVQLCLIAWERFFFLRTIKWTTLIIAIIGAYLVVEIFANRPPIRVFIQYFTFSSGTAFTRVAQWDCGMISVARNPWLGFGLGGTWDRCPMVTNSIDNFYLALAMRNGAPAILALLAGLVLLILAVARRRLTDPRTIAYRYGALFSVIGVCVGGATVHFWNATYCMFMFLLGAVAWLADAPEGRAAPAAAAPPPIHPRNVARLTQARGAMRSPGS